MTAFKAAGWIIYQDRLGLFYRRLPAVQLLQLKFYWRDFLKSVSQSQVWNTWHRHVTDMVTVRLSAASIFPVTELCAVHLRQEHVTWHLHPPTDRPTHLFWAYQGHIQSSVVIIYYFLGYYLLFYVFICFQTHRVCKHSNASPPQISCLKQRLWREQRICGTPALLT